MSARKIMLAAGLGLAMALTAPASAIAADIYVSSKNSGKAGGVRFADEDVMLFEGDPETGVGTWRKYFDGSDVGLRRDELAAFHVVDDSNMLLSLDKPKCIAGIGYVDESDILQFTGAFGPATSGVFSLFFDGHEFGLGGGRDNDGDSDSDSDSDSDGIGCRRDHHRSHDRNEGIDAIAFTDLGELVISTNGNFKVPGPSGDIRGRDEDLIVFSNTMFPLPASGTWTELFDGSDHGLRRSSEDVVGAWLNPAGGFLYLTTKGNFNVPGSSGNLKGKGTDIFFCDLPGGCNTFERFFVGKNAGFKGGSFDGIHLELNQSPVVTKSGAAPTFTEGDIPVIVDGAIAVTDDGPTLASATVTIANLLDGGLETLAAMASGGIAAGDISYVAPTLTIAPGVPQSVADFVAVLQSVTYENTSEDPDETVRSIDFVANDGSGNSNTETVPLIVKEVNDQPSITLVGNQMVDEDAGAQSVASFATAFDPGAVDEAGQSILDFVVTNDNNALFTVQPDIDNSGELTYTAAADASGVATVTVQVQDDGGTANGGVDLSVADMFTITVDPLNDAPSITIGGNQTVDEDAGAQSVASFATGFAPGGGADEAGQAIADFIVTNDNNALFSVQPDIDNAGQLTYTSAADANGVATVTVQVQDDGGAPGVDLSVADMFTITVNEVNDAPSITIGGNQAVDEDAGAQSVASFATGFAPGGGADESGQAIADFVVTNDNNALFSAQPDIDNSGQLTYTPAAATSGVATVTVQVQDDGGTSPGVDLSVAQMFTITVTPPNAPPVIAGGATAAVDAPENQIAVTDVSSTDDNDSETVAPLLIYSLTTVGGGGVDNGKFDLTTNTGVLTFKIAPDFENKQDADTNNDYEVQVTVTDDGPGANLTDMQNITVNVTNVNEAPAATAKAFSATGNVTIDVNAAAGLVAGSSDPEGDARTVNAVTGITAGAIVNFNADGSFDYTPPPGFTGPTDSFNFTLTDGALPSNQVAVTVTVADIIWFIDNNVSGGANDGRLNSPFESLAAFDTANDNVAPNPQNGHCIFLHTGNANYTGGVTLLTNQDLVGQGSSDTFSTTILDECEFTLAALSDTSSITTGTDPVITATGGTNNGINLASGNTIRGLDIGNTGGTGMSGGVVGSLKVLEVAISGTGGGIEVNTSGSLSVAFEEISSSNATGIDLTNVTNSFTVTTGTINSGANVAVSIDGNNASKIALAVILESVSASGGTTNGIDINDTTGSFTVTGTGGAGTGGTIQNMTGDGVTLNDVENISLADMNITNNDDNGIKGTDVLGFVLDNSVVNLNANALTEAGLLFSNLTGDGTHPTAITNSTISNSIENNAVVLNSSGTLTNLLVTNSTFGPTQFTSGNSGLQFLSTGGTMTITVSGSTFINNKNSGLAVDTNSGTVTVDVSGTTNVFSGVNTQATGCSVSTGIQSVGVNLTMTSTGNINFDIEDSTFDGHNSNAINLRKFSTSTGTLTGTISGNTVGLSNGTNDGSCTGFGILLQNEGSGTATVLIDNNIVRQIDGSSGDAIRATKAVAGGTSNVTISNNNVDDVGDIGRGINVLNTIAGGTTCANIFGNDLMTNIGNADDIQVRRTNGTFNLVQTSEANLSSVNNNNVADFVGTITTSAATCATP